jgi:hypothetical protein
VSTVGPSAPFAKPKLFLSFPSPFGEATGEEGYFAITVTNPTNQTMTVRKVALFVATPNTEGIISGIDQTLSYPTTNWSNPAENVILWESIANPITIKQFSTSSWRAAITSSAVSTG